MDDEARLVDETEASTDEEDEEDDEKEEGGARWLNDLLSAPSMSDSSPATSSDSWSSINSALTLWSEKMGKDQTREQLKLVNFIRASTSHAVLQFNLIWEGAVHNELIDH